MAQTIKLKRSSVSGNVPTPAQLELGEVAINTFDGKVFIKKDNGSESVVEVGALSGGASSLLDLTDVVSDGTFGQVLTTDGNGSFSFTSASGAEAIPYTRSAVSATAGQTVFSISYAIGFVDVYLNGVKLTLSTDYTADNGSSVTLLSPAASGDTVELVAYSGTPISQVSLFTVSRYNFIAGNGQTTFTSYDENARNLTYTPNAIDVYLNGVLLTDSEFTATTGTSVVLATPASTGDIIRIVDYGTAAVETGASYATTSFVTSAVNAAVAGLLDSAPAALDTLNELAAALGDDADFAGTVTTSLAAKANTADLATVATTGAYSDLTGTPTLATVATTGAYSDLTGTPTVPTALTDLSITDGTAGQVLSADGDGTYTFIDAASGGGGSFEAVASGSISDGAPTVLNSNGTVSVVGQEVTTSLLQTLNNPNAYGTTENDRFGEQVSISGNYAIVSTTYEEGSGGEGRSGSAYIFNVTTGALLHTLNNPNAFGSPLNDYFGCSIGIDGNYAIVGAYAEESSGGEGSSGRAYIFNVTTGALVRTLNNPNAYSTSASDFFGYVVAISGNYAIVGAFGEDYVGGTNSGRTYIFNVTTGALVRTIDNPSSSPTGNAFPRAAAISGNYALLGAPTNDDVGGTGSGRAYIFNVTTGALVHTFNNPNAYGTSANDNFGYSVSISDNYAIVGAYNEDDAGGTSSGKAYIFNVTTGALVHTLNNPNAYDTSLNDNFGYSVAISDDYAIVGAYQEDDAGGAGSGKAYIFNLTTGGLIDTLDNPSPVGTSVGDAFGFAVAISANNIIVGAYQEDDANPTSGKAYIYDLPGTPISNLTAENYAGIADAAYADAATATIQTAGSVDDAQSGLTPGQAYYVQPDGTLGLTPGTPSVFAGTAVSATSLLIGKEAPAGSVAYADVTGTPDLSSYATETYVDTAVSNLVDTAPEALNTLNELAAALGDDANFAGTVTTSLAAKANTADLATVATTGAYSDLTGTPTLATVATSGSYSDLSDQPVIPSTLTDLGIADGTANQVLTTDGLGAFTFADASAGASVTISDTAPNLPSAGDLWWDSTSLTPFIYYSDATSNQWVEFANPDSGGSTVVAYADITGTPDLSSYATETYVDTAVSNLVDTAPEALNTLNELAAALGDDADFAGSVTTSLAAKANTADLATVATSGAYADITGTPTIPADVSDLTDTTALLGGGGGSFEAVASGSLSDGSTVVLNADGTVSVVEESVTPAGPGIPAVFENASIQYTSATFDSANNTVVIAYQDEGNSNYGTAIVGTVSGKSIIFGSPVVFESASTTYISTTFDSANNKVVIAYRDGGNSSYGTAIVGTVSGTSISFGSPAVFKSAVTTHISATFDSANNKIVISYSATYGRAVVGTVSGTSISFGSEWTFVTGTATDIRTTFDSNSNKIVVSYKNSSNYLLVGVGTVSDTSISFGSFSSLGPNKGGQAVTFDSANNKIVITYTDGDNSNYGTARVGTVSGTSISFGTPVVFKNSATSAISATFDSISNKIVISHKDGSNPYYDYIIVGTVSDTSISFGSPYTFSTTGLVSISTYFYSATFDSENNKVVIAYADRGNSEYGTAVVFDTLGTPGVTNLTAENYVGISNAAYSDASTATIQTVGSIDDAQSGLTPGQAYYVQANGSLATTPDTPSVFAGVAINSTSLLIGKSEPATAANAATSVTTYANVAALPVSGNIGGDLAFVTDVKAFYGWNGIGWDRIFSGANTLPEFTISPAASYELSSTGTPTIVTVDATDPEGFDITYSHDTSPANQAQATITNSGGTFTITPDTNIANAGTFTLRFKIFDGVRTNSASSTFLLRFTKLWANDDTRPYIAYESGIHTYFMVPITDPSINPGQWQYSNNNGSTWTNFSAAGTIVATESPLIFNGVEYSYYAQSAGWSTGNTSYIHRFVPAFSGTTSLGEVIARANNAGNYPE